MGPSGGLLNHVLRENGGGDLREHALVTNAYLCGAETDQDRAVATVCCAPRLYRELEQVSKESPIVALGKEAAASILNVKSIMLARGFVWTAKTIDEDAIRHLQKKASKTGDRVDGLKHAVLAGRAKLAGRHVLPTIHPAFVLRLDSWSQVLKWDLERAVRFIKGKLRVEDLEDQGTYRVLSTPTKVEEALLQAAARRFVVRH